MRDSGIVEFIDILCILFFVGPFDGNLNLKCLRVASHAPRVWTANTLGFTVTSVALANSHLAILIKGYQRRDKERVIR